MPVSKRQYRKSKLSKKKQYRKSKLSKKKQYRKLKLKGGSKRKLKLLKRGSKRKSKLKGGMEGPLYDVMEHGNTIYDLTPTQEALAKNLTVLKSKWFYESFNRVQAENELADKPKGTFLVRPSSKKRSEDNQAVTGSTRSQPYLAITVQISLPGAKVFWHALIEENDKSTEYFFHLETPDAEILQFPGTLENLVATLMTNKLVAQKIGLPVDLTLKLSAAEESLLLSRKLSAEEEEFGIDLSALESSREYSRDDLIDNDINIHTKLKSRGKFTIRSDCVNNYLDKSEDGTFIIYKSRSEMLKLPTDDLGKAFGNYDFTYHGTLAVREKGKTKNVYIIQAENNAPPLPSKGSMVEQIPDPGGYGLFYPFEKADSDEIYGDVGDVQAKSTGLYSSVAELLANQTIITANNYYRNNRTTKGYLVCNT